MMSIKVISSGFYSTIQDLGRFGYRQYGIPQSGVMDGYSAKIANLLVGNRRDAAVLETTMIGGEYLFTQNTRIAIGGLDAQIELNGTAIALNECHIVSKDDRLKIGQITKGIRVYLGVKGGFQTKKKLGSRSFYSPITSQNQIRSNDILAISKFNLRDSEATASLKFNGKPYHSTALKVYKGPEWSKLSKSLQKELLNSFFSISKNQNRQAYQLKEKLKNDLEPILTQPVLPGTVQLTPGGNIIILMRDAQVTGGYPRIFQLTEDSINKLTQKRVNDKVNFHLAKIKNHQD